MDPKIQDDLTICFVFYVASVLIAFIIGHVAGRKAEHRRLAEAENLKQSAEKGGTK